MVTLITGPQGSGKTTYANSLIHESYNATHVRYERLMLSGIKPVFLVDSNEPRIVVVDSIPEEAYSNDEFKALLAGFDMAAGTNAHLILICQEPPIQILTPNINWVQCESSSHGSSFRREQVNGIIKLMGFALLLMLSFSMQAQCLQGQGYLNTAKVDSAECVEYVTPVYDLPGYEIDIYYRKTIDSVLVYWPNCDRKSMYFFYQDTTCERSVRESVFMYNESIRQVTKNN